MPFSCIIVVGRILTFVLACSQTWVHVRHTGRKWDVWALRLQRVIFLMLPNLLKP
jgi:hypothetical protein